MMLHKSSLQIPSFEGSYPDELEGRDSTTSSSTQQPHLLHHKRMSTRTSSGNRFSYYTPASSAAEVSTGRNSTGIAKPPQRTIPSRSSAAARLPQQQPRQAMQTRPTVQSRQPSSERSHRRQPQKQQPPQPQPTQAQQLAADEKQFLLSQKLTTYARGCDRRQTLRLLTSNQYTKMYTLKNVEVEDIAAAEREASAERGILNGVKFLQVRGSSGVVPKSNDPNQPMDSYFLQTLREICGHMCDMDGVYADPMALYGGLLLRLSRTVSERDALELVTSWLGNKELVVLPLKRRHHFPSYEVQQTTNVKSPQPVDIELYVESGNVHTKVTMSHEFGLYRKSDLESHGLALQLKEWNALVSQSPMTQYAVEKLRHIQYEVLNSPRFLGTLKPWIFVDAEVVERVNFGSGDHVRLLYVSVPERKNSGYAAIY